MSIVQRVLDIARSQVGVTEKGGNNHGPEVREYLAATGLPEGNPWCAALLAWTFKKAGVRGWPMTGDTWAIRDWAVANGCLHDTPQAGDVFLLYNSAGPTHTGFVASAAMGDGMAWCIEGNTGGPSDTDGDGVYHKRRSVAGMKFVRWADVLGDKKPSPARVVYYKTFDHDGKRALILPDGTRLDVVGVKVNGVPWAGGDILIGVREEAPSA